MSELSYKDALKAALSEEMRRDERVFLLGEDIGVYGGAFGVTDGLLREFGEDRVRDTPISEAAIAGAATGAALGGFRPVAEFQFFDFILIAMDQIINQAAKIRYMFGGNVSVPVVFRGPAGAGTGAAAQHSQSLEAIFAHIPGLKVIAPSTPRDAKGLLTAAIRDDNPVIFVEHKLLYKQKGEVPDGQFVLPIGVSEVKRQGKDVTVVATSIMVPRALAAANRLAVEGIEVEVIDPRTLSPLDMAPIEASIRKTGRVLVVHEAVKSGGIGAEIAARIAEGPAFDYLDSQVGRLGGAFTPVPYSDALERCAIPQEEDIVVAVKNLLA
ncbi:MAG TPA: alpha-ketoacid dehydrogenase subunit beta [Candidatus Dormibacteraeota bacterium]